MKVDLAGQQICDPEIEGISILRSVELDPVDIGQGLCHIEEGVGGGGHGSTGPTTGKASVQLGAQGHKQFTPLEEEIFYILTLSQLGVYGYTQQSMSLN